MKILFVAPYVPSRIRVRPFHFIQELSRRHEVHVVALEEPGGAVHEGVNEIDARTVSFRIVPHSKLKGYIRCFLALGGTSPMCTAYSKSGAMMNSLAEIVQKERFDIVHIEHLRAARFAVPDGQVPMLLDSVDCLTNLFKLMAQSRKNPISRLVSLRESACLRRYEPRMLAGFDRLIVTTHTERQELVALDPQLSPEVVPNGVDADYFTPQNACRRPRRFILTGKMSYAPNAQAARWFAGNVFPTVRREYPDAEFVIAGSDPPPGVADLARIPGITVTGYVPDLRPYLESASIAVATMQVAVGIQNKILEAMAMGLPVIASRSTCRAFGGDCPGIIPADTPEEATLAALQLAGNASLADEMGQHGRKTVLQGFTWQSSVAKLERIYTDMHASREQSKI